MKGFSFLEMKRNKNMDEYGHKGKQHNMHCTIVNKIQCGDLCFQHRYQPVVE